jgi:glutamyl-tRNA reductase
VLLAELEKSLGGRLKHLPEADRAALTQMMESATNKLLHAPTTRLRASTATDDVNDHVRALKHLFDLPEMSTTPAAVEPAAQRPPEQGAAPGAAPATTDGDADAERGGRLPN